MLGKWWTLKTLVYVAVMTYVLAQLQKINIDEDVNIKKAVDFFNSQENTHSVFKQISYLASGYEQIDEDFDILNFLVKETVCTKFQEYKLEECDFRPEGEIKMCSTYVSEELASHNVACTTISENMRSKRAPKKKCNFLCKLRAGSRSTIATAKTPNWVVKHTFA